jgi:hypothetical protein
MIEVKDEVTKEKPTLFLSHDSTEDHDEKGEKLLCD